MYFLSKTLLDKIEDEKPNGILEKLALELHLSADSIRRIIRKNEEDNDLTKAVATDFFYKEFGMNKEQALTKKKPVLDKKTVASTA